MTEPKAANGLRDKFVPKTPDECSMEDLVGHGFKSGPCPQETKQPLFREIPRPF